MLQMLQVIISSLEFSMGYLTYQASTHGFPLKTLLGGMTAIIGIVSIIGRYASLYIDVHATSSTTMFTLIGIFFRHMVILRT